MIQFVKRLLAIRDRLLGAVACLAQCQTLDCYLCYQHVTACVVLHVACSESEGVTLDTADARNGESLLAFAVNMGTLPRLRK